MERRSVFTNTTPLPAHVSRETMVEILHQHSAMIEMNPLVLRHEQTDAPPTATPEEVRVMTWYSITDEIVYVPGTRLKGETVYKAGFYNLPTGLQTHVFAPAGVDIRAKWSVGGSLPGEEKESVELGLNAPRDGLYLREDVDLRCSVFVMSFVKSSMKRGHDVLHGKLIDNASLAQNTKDSEDSIHRRQMDTTCACEGVSHESNCELHVYPSHIERPVLEGRRAKTVAVGRTDIDAATVQRNSFDQTPTSAYLPRSTAGLPPCRCTGGVHTPTCPQHPGLTSAHSRSRSLGPDLFPTRHEQQQQPYQLALPTAPVQGPSSAYARENPYSFSKPQSPTANALSSYSGHTFRPQRPGEQAELPAIADRDAGQEIYAATELRPNPLLIRTQHGHAAATELEGDADVASAYWQQRVRNDGGMARG